MTIYKRLCTFAFLIAESILYYLILTAPADHLVVRCYSAIILCLVYALAIQGKPLLIAAIAGTVVADYYLVTFIPPRQLPGMAVFLVVQLLYAIYLHRQGYKRVWVAIRLIPIAMIIAGALLILKENADALAIISVLYYANLVMNAVMAFGKFKKSPLLAIGFLLFILCDTVIGLQVASTGYLPIEEGSLLHNILYMDLNLVWLFYLPSQVLIALAGTAKE